MPRHLLAMFAAAMLAGCTQQPTAGSESASGRPDARPSPSTASGNDATADPAGTPLPHGTASSTPMRSPVAVGEPDPTGHAGAILTPDGVAGLRIGGQAPDGWPKMPAGKDGCRNLAADGFPGGYAIYEGGKIRRLSFAGASKVRTEEGIGPGSVEKAVRDAFPGLLVDKHKYAPAPAKYLTVPHPGGAPGLRFEIGSGGSVKLMSAGLSPQLEYVDGCG